MKCSFCKSHEADYVTTTERNICHKCVEENNYVICTQCGTIVPIAQSEYPYTESLCDECFNKE